MTCQRQPVPLWGEGLGPLPEAPTRCAHPADAIAVEQTLQQVQGAAQKATGACKRACSPSWRKSSVQPELGGRMQVQAGWRARAAMQRPAEGQPTPWPGVDDGNGCALLEHARPSHTWRCGPHSTPAPAQRVRQASEPRTHLCTNPGPMYCTGGTGSTGVGAGGLSTAKPGVAAAATAAGLPLCCSPAACCWCWCWCCCCRWNAACC